MTLALLTFPSSSSVSLDVAPSFLLSRRLLRCCSVLAALLKGFSLCLCTLKVPGVDARLVIGVLQGSILSRSLSKFRIAPGHRQQTSL